MRTYEFQDIDGQEVRVQYSGGGNVRIYLKRENVDTGSLHLTLHQANILISAVSELVEQAE